jgi:hypothetical protein
MNDLESSTQLRAGLGLLEEKHGGYLENPSMLSSRTPTWPLFDAAAEGGLQESPPNLAYERVVLPGDGSSSARGGSFPPGGGADGISEVVALEAPFWVPDQIAAACERCGVAFSMLRRRTHCRSCGHVFCRKCCSKEIFLQVSGYSPDSGPQRVCHRCYGKLHVSKIDALPAHLRLRLASFLGPQGFLSCQLNIHWHQVMTSEMADLEFWRPLCISYLGQATLCGIVRKHLHVYQELWGGSGGRRESSTSSPVRRQQPRKPFTRSISVDRGLSSIAAVGSPPSSFARSHGGRLSQQLQQRQQQQRLQLFSSPAPAPHAPLQERATLTEFPTGSMPDRMTDSDSGGFEWEGRVSSPAFNTHHAAASSAGSGYWGGSGGAGGGGFSSGGGVGALVASSSSSQQLDDRRILAALHSIQVLGYTY